LLDAEARCRVAARSLGDEYIAAEQPFLKVLSRPDFPRAIILGVIRIWLQNPFRFSCRMCL
jgi:hypothetical protein